MGWEGEKIGDRISRSNPVLVRAQQPAVLNLFAGHAIAVIAGDLGIEVKFSNSSGAPKMLRRIIFPTAET
jgi:hypothetical protein